MLRAGRKARIRETLAWYDRYLGPEAAKLPVETVNAADKQQARHFARCAQCGSSLVIPEWSERVSERCVRYLWACDACGYGFETSVYFPKEDIAA